MAEKFVLVGGGWYKNLGCEAIVRGTLNILNKEYPNSTIELLSTYNCEEDFRIQTEIEHDKRITHKKLTLLNNKTKGCIHALRVLSLNNTVKGQIPDPVSKMIHNVLFNRFEDHTSDDYLAYLSIGGDLYSMDYGIPTLWIEMDNYFSKFDNQYIIWGASIGPFSSNIRFENFMSNHLRKSNAIFAREDMTIQYLRSVGLEKNIFRMSDPAFLLEPEPIKNTIEVLVEGAVGINLSPLMSRYIGQEASTEWMGICCKIIETTIDVTGKNVVLIPHVVTKDASDDYLFMNDVCKKLNSHYASKTFLLPPTLNAAETKESISRLSFFVGCRTHSTIASFSSCVPTVSITYSMKGTGINLDIFGHDLYCIPVNSFSLAKYRELIINIENSNDEIRMELKSKIADVKARSQSAGKILKNCIEMSEKQDRTIKSFQ